MEHTLRFNLQSYFILHCSLLLNKFMLLSLCFHCLSLHLDPIQYIVKLFNLVMHLLLKFLLIHCLLICFRETLSLCESLFKYLLGSLGILFELRLPHEPYRFQIGHRSLLFKAHLVDLLPNLQVVLPPSFPTLAISLQ